MSIMQSPTGLATLRMTRSCSRSISRRTAPCLWLRRLHTTSRSSFASVAGANASLKSASSNSISEQTLFNHSGPPDDDSIKPNSYFGRQTDRLQRIEVTDRSIIISLDGTKHELPNRWLRDHCRCDRCVNQDTKQRAFETFSQENRKPRPVEAEGTLAGLQVTWDSNHTSTYYWNWIVERTAGQYDREPSHMSDRTSLWGAEVKENPPSVHYDEVMAGDQGVAKWTSKIHKFGFCFVDGCPISPERTQELLERIAFIRVTHYGGFYDFTSDLTMKDTAYTSLALPAHTDTTYFSDPAGLQMFHLLSHTDGQGGASLLVDGFACAHQLYKENEHAFSVLSKTPIQWHASGNDGIIITPSSPQPVLKLQPQLQDGKSDRLQQIRWNNDDRAAMDMRNPKDVDEWYEAAQAWHNIVTDKKNEYWEQLVPGRALIFNNWRVMHGRSSFTGKRRMCGGYVNRDDFISRYMNTNLGKEKIFNWLL